MTTFGYAYHADSREILEGRRAFAKVKAIMCGLDGKAFDTANNMVKAEYGPPPVNPFPSLLGDPLGVPRDMQFAMLLQRQAMQASAFREQSILRGGLLGGSFCGLL